MRMYEVKLNPLPTSFYSGRTKQTPGKWSHNGMIRDHDVLLIMLSGECRFDFKEREPIIVKQGEAALIPAGRFYTGSCSQVCEYGFFNIPCFCSEVSEGEAERQMLEDILIDAESVETVKHRMNMYSHSRSVEDHLFMREVTDVGRSFRNLVNLLLKCDIEIAKGGLTRSINFDLTLAQIIVIICEESMRDFTQMTVYPTSLERILAYIVTHYTEPITLEHLADEFGLTKQYIGRLFRRYLNTTVTAYITDLKLSYAPELIRYSTMNVSEIAAHLGFSSANYFTRLFRAKYSVTPRDYR